MDYLVAEKAGTLPEEVEEHLILDSKAVVVFQLEQALEEVLDHGGERVALAKPSMENAMAQVGIHHLDPGWQEIIESTCLHPLELGCLVDVMDVD